MQLIFKKGLLLSAVLATVILVGCNPDTRLDGKWEGTLWAKGVASPNLYTWEFNKGEFSYSFPITLDTGRTHIVTYKGFYTTNRTASISEIDFTDMRAFAMGTELDVDLSDTKSLYTFKQGTVAQELWIMDMSDKRPSSDALSKTEGPVFICTPTGATKSAFGAVLDVLLHDSLSHILQTSSE